MFDLAEDQFDEETLEKLGQKMEKEISLIDSLHDLTDGLTVLLVHIQKVWPHGSNVHPMLW